MHSIQCNGIPWKDSTLPAASHHGFLWPLTITALSPPARGGSSYCTVIRQGELQYNTCEMQPENCYLAKILHLKSIFILEKKKSKPCGEIKMRMKTIYRNILTFNSTLNGFIFPLNWQICSYKPPVNNNKKSLKMLH